MVGGEGGGLWHHPSDGPDGDASRPLLVSSGKQCRPSEGVKCMYLDGHLQCLTSQIAACISGCATHFPTEVTCMRRHDLHNQDQQQEVGLLHMAGESSCGYSGTILSHIW